MTQEPTASWNPFTVATSMMVAGDSKTFTHIVHGGRRVRNSTDRAIAGR